MKTLFLKRHGERNGASDSLTDKGIKQTSEFGKSLKPLFDKNRVLVLSSPLKRTLHTTKLLLVNAGQMTDNFSVIDGLHEREEIAGVVQGIGKYLSSAVDVALCVTHYPVIVDEIYPFMEQRGFTPKIQQPEAYLYESDQWEDFGFNPQLD